MMRNAFFLNEHCSLSVYVLPVELSSFVFHIFSLAMVRGSFGRLKPSFGFAIIIGDCLDALPCFRFTDSISINK